MAKKLAPVHPGEILLEDFMEPLGLSCAELARKLDVPTNRISQVLQKKRNVSVDTALRLECFFGVSADTWLNLQQHYDLQIGKNTLWTQIKKVVKPNETAA
ncbi:MAG: addiction module antidote protein, HigA family [Alphaproteobacteria bacterium RIFCSPLOWO2_01_FULL_45_8]|nr:MAG: addiction module antidote protein, HigA family [Alphaproteobacteria bacterium GWA1_45_9]OFW90117.1 MAG: addiction module antidote protein, HigA family [Alphaproteobacteria bacterium RIFCSPHIGHO2_01_FULL_41_14]OFW96583.1 MAG: addiction module antidote protein, HigA family [Alphaproteobacteria bacterium RIFCSPLOWO2_01_FULL_45_8]HCI49097.1 addiction module antidote protein, HigA family [Holosporales bacterium]